MISAKPQTKAFDENGRMRFLGHPEDGSILVEEYSGETQVQYQRNQNGIIDGEISPSADPDESGQLPTGRAIYRYFRDVGDAGIDTLYLSLADHLATRGPGIIDAAMGIPYTSLWLTC